MKTLHKVVLALASWFAHGTSNPAPQANRALEKIDALTQGHSPSPKQDNDGRGFLLFGMPRIIQSACAVLAAVALLGTATIAQADWPEKPITSISVDIHWAEDGDEHDHITNWWRDAFWLEMTVTLDNPDDKWVKYCFYGPGIPYSQMVHKDESSHDFDDVEAIIACPGYWSGGYWFDVNEYSLGGDYNCVIMEKDPKDPGNVEKYKVVASIHFYLGMSKAYVFSNRNGAAYYIDITYDHWLFQARDPNQCDPVYGYMPGSSGDN